MYASKNSAIWQIIWSYHTESQWAIIAMKLSLACTCKIVPKLPVITLHFIFVQVYCPYWQIVNIASVHNIMTSFTQRISLYHILKFIQLLHISHRLDETNKRTAVMILKKKMPPAYINYLNQKVISFVRLLMIGCMQQKCVT